MQKKRGLVHIFKLTTNLVTSFLKDYLQVLLAIILKTGQEAGL